MINFLYLLMFAKHLRVDIQSYPMYEYFVTAAIVSSTSPAFVQ